MYVGESVPVSGHMVAPLDSQPTAAAATCT